ncbi:hypothetical protein PSTG_04708 [Puccinia striiformis f. sp. tritici PST-78]|uniref:Uncharacterized protein n=1 Tax=Puccinia striiformis f. sp. tritici PST-78 TaxID=1165861 RepID=A0A0L0VSF6_9BASI|nr:hypothetical protein PSTG_04708 [Puccinia striiformis f. sp. tritici PST-78]
MTVCDIQLSAWLTVRSAREGIHTFLKSQIKTETSPFGKPCFSLSIQGILSQDLANPLVSPHLEYYPEKTDGPYYKFSQSKKWLEELAPQHRAQMCEVDEEHYYLFEPVELASGLLVVPIFFYSQESQIYSKCIAPQIKGFMKDNKLKSYAKIQFNGYKLAEECADALYEHDGKGNQKKIQLPDPWRKKADGRIIRNVPITLYANKQDPPSLAWQVNVSDRGRFEMKMSNSRVTGLNIPPINANGMVKHNKSLGGKDFKVLVQVAPFTCFKYLTPEHRAIWTALCELVPFIFVTKINNMEEYQTQLKAQIQNFIYHCVKVTGQWVNKPKFHHLLHLPESILCFGPASLCSTEKSVRFKSPSMRFWKGDVLSLRRIGSVQSLWEYHSRSRSKFYIHFNEFNELYSMREVSRTRTKQYVNVNEIEACINVQHNCDKGNCPIRKTKPSLIERQETEIMTA